MPIEIPRMPQQPQADEGADNADDDVTDQAEAEAAHDLAGKPAGDQRRRTA